MQIVRHTRLAAEALAGVRTLVEAASEHDGVHPLSEHVVLHLRHGGDDSALSLLACEGDDVVGYAHLDTTDTVEGSSAEMVVAPHARRRGVGRALVQELLTAVPDGRLRLWSHGSHPGAAAMAAELGFDRTRVLWQMRRSLLAPLPAPELARGRPGAHLRPRRRRALAAGQQPRLRRPPRAGTLDPRRRRAPGRRALVRPGRLLPGRARRRAARVPLDQGARRRAARRPRPRPARRGLRRRGGPVRPAPRPGPGDDPAWGCGTCAPGG